MVPFVIWQEVGIDDQEAEETTDNKLQTEIKKVGSDLKNTILDTSSRKECEMESGIFIKSVCHYYQVLSDLCIKVNFDFDDNGKVTGLHYVNGCYADGSAMKFKPAKVGSYYDFETSVNLQIRATQDPYMVLTYTRDNLGTDFRVFLYLSIFCLVGTMVASTVVIYYLCCYFEKKRGSKIVEGEEERLNTPPKVDNEVELH